MKAIRILLGIVLLLPAGCLVYGQTGFTGDAELLLEFSPATPSMSDSRIEVRVFADLANVKAGSGAAILSSYSVPVGFDPSYVRLVSVEPGQASGYSAAGFAWTQPAAANGRGLVTVMNSRSGDQDPGKKVELGRLVFELNRPGNASFIAGSARTAHQGTLAGIVAGSGSPGRISWADHEYTVRIGAGATIPSLLCPTWFSVPGMFQGMALLNQGSGPASIQMFGWGMDGTLVQSGSAVNPSTPVSLPGLNQKAGLASEFFKIPDATDVENGWIEIRADTPDISGFFMQGVNNSDGETQQMDGIKMTYSPSSTLLFPLIRAADRPTEIALANPGSSPVNTVIRVKGSAGQVIRTVTVRLPAHGVSVQEIGDATSTEPVYADVRATGGQITGVQRFGTQESLSILDGQDAALASTRLAGPQFASGFLGGSMRMDTSIALVNPSDSSTTVIIRLLDESGDEIAAPAVRTMAPGSLISTGGWELFGLPNPRTTLKLTVGTLSIESDVGIIGAQSFGDPVSGKYLAALPLMSTSSAKREIFFGHVAVGVLGKVDYFTGVAMVNPSTTDTAHINVELHGLDGAILAKTTTPYSLGPGSRNAQLVQQLIPNFPASQFGGYIRLTSDIEVHAYMLIGDNYYNFLSAVP